MFYLFKLVRADGFILHWLYLLLPSTLLLSIGKRIEQISRKNIYVVRWIPVQFSVLASSWSMGPFVDTVWIVFRTKLASRVCRRFPRGTTRLQLVQYVPRTTRQNKRGNCSALLLANFMATTKFGIQDGGLIDCTNNLLLFAMKREKHAAKSANQN